VALRGTFDDVKETAKGFGADSSIRKTQGEDSDARHDSLIVWIVW